VMTHDLVTVSQKRSSVPKAVAWFSGAPRSYPRITESKTTSALRLVERNLNCNWGASTISRDSLPALATIQDVIRGEVCGLVGVGRGAIARDLFALGAKVVVGIDLLSDFPSSSGLGTAYLPPELPSGLRPFSWQWCPHVFSEGGDWYSERASAQLLASDPQVIVVDIQTGMRDATLKIDPLIKKGYKGFIVIREILSIPELDEVSALLGGVMESLGVYKGKGTATPCEYWFVGKLAGQTAWSRTNLDPITPAVRNLRRVGGSPSAYWYPDVTDTLYDYLFQGRVENRNVPIDSLRNVLLNRLVSSRPGDVLSNHERRELFTSVAVLSTIGEMLSSVQSCSSDKPKERSAAPPALALATVAAGAPPDELFGVKGKIDPREWYRLFTRVVPRLFRLFEL